MITIRKITIGKEDDYTAGRLLDSSKQQALFTGVKAIPQINFTGNLT